jgi:hypothetical protein
MGKWKTKQYVLEVNVQQMLCTIINVLNSEGGEVEVEGKLQYGQ